MGSQPHGQPIGIVSLCCVTVVCELIFIKVTGFVQVRSLTVLGVINFVGNTDAE